MVRYIVDKWLPFLTERQVVFQQLHTWQLILDNWSFLTTGLLDLCNSQCQLSIGSVVHSISCQEAKLSGVQLFKRPVVQKTSCLIDQLLEDQ